MKKVLAAALLCTVSAFATWDYFPVKDAGKGEAKVGVNYFMQDKISELGINLGARFSVIQGLEVAAMFWAPGFTVMSDYDGNDGPTGLGQPALGVRYWLPMGLGVAVDVLLPFQGDDFGGGDAAYLGFIPAVQYSTKLTNELELGAEVSFGILLENEAKITPPKELGIGLELDYSLGSITPLVGVDFAIEVTKAQFDGNDVGETATGIFPYVGAIFTINDMLSADVLVGLGFGEDYLGSDKMPINIQANLSVNF
jgi:hypothetical protein